MNYEGKNDLAMINCTFLSIERGLIQLFIPQQVACLALDFLSTSAPQHHVQLPVCPGRQGWFCETNTPAVFGDVCRSKQLNTIVNEV